MEAIPKSRYYLLLTVFVLALAIDLGTKTWVFGFLGMPGEQPVHWLIPDVLGLQTSLNEGALFGMGQGLVPLFVVLSVVAVIGLLYWLFLAGGARELYLTIVLGLVMAGILGNLYDRLGLHGLHWNFATRLHEVGEPVYAVRDWILIMIGPFAWPNFNVADSLLVMGACLLGWYIVRMPAEPYAPSDDRDGRQRDAKQADGASVAPSSDDASRDG